MKRCLEAIEKNVKYLVEVTPVNTAVNIEKKCYADSRSAAFYAMGKAIKTQDSVVLLVPGTFLSSTYTAITEAWFQKANVIVISLFDKVSEVKTTWMDRCVIKTLTTTIEEIEEIEAFLCEGKKCRGPVLLNLVGKDFQKKKYDYSRVIGMLQDRKIAIRCFNGIDDTLDNIVYKDKYGVLSKYIGMSTVKDCGILLCTSDCVAVDVNIFRTRYANSNMKIIIFDQGDFTENNIELWIESNGWDCRIVDLIEDDSIHWLVSNDKQSVLIQKEA